MMKLLEDLTPEELQNLYRVNKKLKELAAEEATETANFWISEILGYFSNIRSIDYNIGYPGTYMQVKPQAYPAFIEACQEMTKTFCILSPETEKKITRAAARVEFYNDARNGYEAISDAKYCQLEKWIDNIVRTAAGEIANHCENELDASYTEEAARDHLEILVDNIGKDYETDGRYIYEIQRRKYA